MTVESPVAILTGAGSGIGRCIALQLALARFRTVLVGRNRANLEETRLLLGGTPSLVLPADIALPVECSRVVETTVSHFGRIDALINNAGYAPCLPLGQQSPALMQEVFAINAIGPANLIVAAWAVFEQQFRRGITGSCIVNISSLATLDPFPGLFAYAAAKASVNLMARSCQNEGKSMGLRAFAVAPGSVETRMLRAIVSEDLLPKDRTLDPNDVAAVVMDCVSGKHDDKLGETIALPSPSHGGVEDS
jgi:NAD(P)-dependent dehydrogenase (short-subunit alcohol dehydrogenase family)